MDRNWMIFFIVAFAALGVVGVAEKCSGAVSEAQWRKMKNTVERLDENVDRLNEKCMVDPLKQRKK